MPITRDQFEEGLTDEMTEWMRLIHEFLQAHKDHAYTEDELREQVKSRRTVRVFFGKPETVAKPTFELESETGPSTKNDVKAFRAALFKLVESEAVEARPAGGLRYYAYKQELPNLE